ncbi:MAG: hypothetical protein M1455_00040 [Actinobacteria bacterium]|nr:hypothetical protein [Actinomycetota bacterium]
MPPSIAAAAAAALIAMLIILSAYGEDALENAPVDVYSPFGLYSPGTLGTLPTSASQMMMDALGFDTIEQYQNYSLGLTTELGVSWVRMDFYFDGWKFIEQPAYLEQLHARGFEVVGCVLPMNSSAPEDLTTFRTNLDHLVRRYPWIKIWQIGNEPDLSWDNPDDYPRFFFAARDEVLANCHDCKIALAGAGARWPGQDMEGWRHSLDVYDRIIGDIASQSPGNAKPFDIIDMHFYDFAGTEERMLETMKDYQSLLPRHGLSPEIDFWVSECATPTGSLSWPPNAPSQTEDQQAAELVARFVTMLGAQVDRVSWARFYENYRYEDIEDGFFDHCGLVYNGLGTEAGSGITAGTKKLGFRAYQTLISQLTGSSQVSRIDDGKYRFSFPDDRSPVYVLWNAGGTEPPSELRGPILVTDVEGDTAETTAEQLTLGSTPVFVNER